MINISRCTSRSPIKPILNYVYVYRKDNKTYTVATDSYKLAIVEYTDNATAHAVGEGYYHAKDWTAFCKKPDTAHLNSLTISKNILGEYPNFDKLLENREMMKQNGIQHTMTASHLIDFIKMTQEIPFAIDTFDISKLYNNERLYLYEVSKNGVKMTLLLMAHY